jgi:hypothetical protein
MNSNSQGSDMTTETRYLNVVRELGFASYSLESARAELAIHKGQGMSTVDHAKRILSTLIERMGADPYLHGGEVTLEHLEAAMASLSSINYGDVENDDIYI